MTCRLPTLRRWSRQFSLLLLLAWVPTATLSGFSSQPKPVVLIAFGDSTTAPRESLRVYAELLEEELRVQNPSARVLNAGVRGNNTQDAANRFQHDVLDHNPDLVILQFGINDSAIDVWKRPPAEQPRVSLAAYKTNLEFFVRALKARGIRIVLMTPNPLMWTPKLKELYGKPPYDPKDPEGMNRLLDTYSQAIRKLAVQERVSLVDVAQAFRDHTRRGGSLDDLLLDGMHPNQQGHRIVAELLSKTVGELLSVQ